MEFKFTCGIYFFTQANILSEFLYTMSFVKNGYTKTNFAKYNRFYLYG